MCGRYSLAVSPEELEEVFEAPVSGTLELPRWNIAPAQDAPVVVVSREGRHILGLRWGLVPHWADAPTVGAHHINARAESVWSTPAFRDAFARRRCLVPADGFYEWARWGGRKVPHWVHHHRGGLLALAGVRERWLPASGEARGEPLHSFAILTTEPNATVAPLHDRMPAIVPPSAWASWLEPHTPVADVLALLRPAPDELLTARQVSTLVNRVEHDDARCVAPVARQDPEPLDLFPG